MKIFKKAKVRIVSFIVFALIVILLIFLIKNRWDMKLAAQDILSLFGAGKK